MGYSMGQRQVLAVRAINGSAGEFTASLKVITPKTVLMTAHVSAWSAGSA